MTAKKSPKVPAPPAPEPESDDDVLEEEPAPKKNTKKFIGVIADKEEPPGKYVLKVVSETGQITVVLNRDDPNVKALGPIDGWIGTRVLVDPDGGVKPLPGQKTYLPKWPVDFYPRLGFPVPYSLAEEPAMPAWVQGMDTTVVKKIGRVFKPTARNISAILLNVPGYAGTLVLETVSDQASVIGPTPWGAEGAKVVERELLKATLQIHFEDLNSKWYMSPKPAVLDAALKVVFEANKYSAVAGYLDDCLEAWQKAKVLGQPSLLEEFSNRVQVLPAHREMARVYFRKFLISAVRRAYTPGCQCDSALILHGAQGVGKSTLLKALFNGYLRQINDVASYDSRLAAATSWCVEMNELVGMNRAEISAVRAFITTSVESMRMKYGREIVTIARPSVIVGTTNDTEWIQDREGDRRWWCVTVVGRDLEWVEKNRDLLWGEAVEAMMAGELSYLTAEEEEARRKLNQSFRMEDPLYGYVAEAVSGRVEMPNKDLISELITLGVGRADAGTQARVNAVMGSLGWDKVRKNTGRVWVKQLGPNDGPIDTPPADATKAPPPAPGQTKLPTPNPVDMGRSALLGSSFRIPPEVMRDITARGRYEQSISAKVQAFKEATDAAAERTAAVPGDDPEEGDSELF